MLDLKQALNVVRGAVCDRSIIPVFTHFHIRKDKIYGFNGHVGISCRFDPSLDMDLTVPGGAFLQAVDRCEADPLLVINDAKDRLLVKSKVRKRRVIRMPLSNEEFPLLQEMDDNKSIEFDEKEAIVFIGVLRRLRPFVSTDASRPWSMSILLRNGYLWAGNNVIVARVPTGKHLREQTQDTEVHMSTDVVDELLRINYAPKRMWITENHVTFDLGQEVIVQGVLPHSRWPDVDSLMTPEKGVRLTPQFKQTVKDLAPFNEDNKFPIVKFDDDVIKTMEGNIYAEDEMTQKVAPCAFHIVPLTIVLQEADEIAFHTYPKAVYWKGANIEGVIAGVVT